MNRLITVRRQTSPIVPREPNRTFNPRPRSGYPLMTVGRSKGISTALALHSLAGSLPRSLFTRLLDLYRARSSLACWISIVLAIHSVDSTYGGRGWGSLLKLYGYFIVGHPQTNSLRYRDFCRTLPRKGRKGVGVRKPLLQKADGGSHLDNCTGEGTSPLREPGSLYTLRFPILRVFLTPAECYAGEGGPVPAEQDASPTGEGGGDRC